MPTNQELRISTLQAAIPSTIGTYEELWHQLWDAQSYPPGTFDERMIRWLQFQTSDLRDNINDLMQLFAESQGFADWDSMGTFNAGGPIPADQIPAVIFTRASFDFIEWTVDPTLIPTLVKVRRRAANTIALVIDPDGVNQILATTGTVLAIDGPTAIFWSISPTKTTVGFQNKSGFEIAEGPGFAGLNLSGVDIWSFNSDGLLMKLKQSHDTPNSLWIGVNQSGQNAVDGDLHGSASIAQFFDWSIQSERDFVWDVAADLPRNPGVTGLNWFQQNVPEQCNADPAATAGRNRGSAPDADNVQVTGDGISPGDWSPPIFPDVVEAAQFDGTNDFYTIAAPGPAGVADGPGFTWNGWRNFEGSDGVLQTLLYIGTGAAFGLKIEKLASNLIQAQWRTAAGVVIGTVVSTSTVVAADGWTNIMLDISGTSAVLRINFTDESNNTPGVAGDIDLTNKWTLSQSDDVAANLLNGCAAEEWAVDESLDLGVDDNAEQFYDSTLNAPRDLLADGTGPSANVLVYLNDPFSSFHINNAPAGTDYVPTGAVADCVGPGNYSPQHIPAGNAPAVGFPGVGTEGFERANSNTGLVDTSEISFSFWARRTAAGSLPRVFISGGADIAIYGISSGRWVVLAENTSGSTVFSWTSQNDGMAVDSAWHHHCGFVNVAAAGTAELYVDAVEDTTPPGTFTTGTDINQTNLGVAVGANVGLGGGLFTGDLSQLAIWPRKIDWGISANIELVRTPDGRCIILPDDGNIDAGGTADYVFNKALATAHQNGGDANDWAVATAGLTSVTGPAT